VGQRMSWRDLVASILIMMLIATYAVFLIGGGLPFAVDNGDMAALSLGLGFAACIIGGWYPPGPVMRAGTVLSAAAVVLALIAMGSESPWVLAVLISCIAILWLTTTWSHYRLRSDGRAALHRGPSRLHRTKDQVRDASWW